MMGRLDFISRISFFLGRSLVLFSSHEVVGFGLGGREDDSPSIMSAHNNGSASYTSWCSVPVSVLGADYYERWGAEQSCLSTDRLLFSAAVPRI
jgi:hypothetical protein